MSAAKMTLSKQQAHALRRMAGKYNTRTAEADQIRGELDTLVAGAREAGGTFREIADLAERSVAWVQGSLQRYQNKNT